MNVASAPVLITGANGFLGAWIIAHLAESGCQVVATDLCRDARRLEQIIDPDAWHAITWRRCDVADVAEVEAVFDEERPSVLIHLAALQIPACRVDPISCARVNVIGHINMFEAAKRYGVRRVIYTSSIAAKPRGPANGPDNLYGVFKKTGEEIARIYWQEHGISSLGLRPHIVYGVGRDDGETSAITRALHAAATRQAYTLPFSTRSCFQYAGDVAEVFRQCAKVDWDGALLSDLTTEVQSTDELVDAIHRVVPGARIDVADEVRMSPTDGFDNSALRSIVGQWSTTSLEEGVRLTVARYRALEGALLEDTVQSSS